MEPLLLVLGVVSLSLYVLPLLVAASRNHPQIRSIAVLNLLLGWTVLGWVGALVWAVTVTPREEDARSRR